MFGRDKPADLLNAISARGEEWRHTNGKGTWAVRMKASAVPCVHKPVSQPACQPVASQHYSDYFGLSGAKKPIILDRVRGEHFFLNSHSHFFLD